MAGDRTHDDAIPLNLVQGGYLLDDLPFAFETVLLLPETGFQYSICGKNNIIFRNLPGVRVPIAAVPNQDLQTFRMRFNLMFPLHESDSRTATNQRR